MDTTRVSRNGQNVARTPEKAQSEAPCPDWLAEIMNEIGRRFDLNTTDGLNGAEDAAARLSEGYGYKAWACSHLASGYCQRAPKCDGICGARG